MDEKMDSWWIKLWIYWGCDGEKVPARSPAQCPYGSDGMAGCYLEKQGDAREPEAGD